MRIILVNLSEDILARLINTLQSPINDLDAYTPLLNILMYGNIELNNFNTAVANLSNRITGLQAPTEPQVLDVDTTIANIEARNQTTN